MTVFLADWLNLLLRWAHIVVGIAWIGASFYFICARFLPAPARKDEPGRLRHSLEVHGGGFYHVEKYTVAPATLPDDLHWFKWEAYLTWVTGVCCWRPVLPQRRMPILIDPSVMALTPGGAIGISLVTLAAGWLIYDGLCRSPIGRHTRLAWRLRVRADRRRRLAVHRGLLRPRRASSMSAPSSARSWRPTSSW